MRFTTSREADKLIAEDLEKIKQIILKRIQPITRIRSIILFGGFGRGEGSFEIVKGKPYSLNDYDLYLITEQKIDDNLLAELSQQCSNAIGMGGREFAETPFEIYDKRKYFHVDLRCIPFNQLRKLKKTNRTLELGYDNVIYGQSIKKELPKFSLSSSEAFRCLFNPACHLLMGMDYRRFQGRFEGDEKFFLSHHINKAYIWIAASMLISAGKFSPSYRESARMFKKMYGQQFPLLAEKIEKAVKSKLIPYKELPNPQKAWQDARNDLFFTFKFLAEKHLGIKEKNISSFIKQVYKKLPYTYFAPYLHLPSLIARAAFPSQYYLNLLYFKRTLYFPSLFYWRDIGIKIALAAFLLLYAKENAGLLKEAAKYIKSFSRVEKRDWESLREALLYAFDKYYSQKLI